MVWYMIWWGELDYFCYFDWFIWIVDDVGWCAKPMLRRINDRIKGTWLGWIDVNGMGRGIWVWVALT